MFSPCVYIVTNHRKGTLYVGVTSNLIQRVWQHKEGVYKGFTKEHGLHRLVWYELHSTMDIATPREKRVKAWKRAWKIELIEGMNPGWLDLYPFIL